MGPNRRHDPDDAESLRCSRVRAREVVRLRRLARRDMGRAKRPRGWRPRGRGRGDVDARAPRARRARAVHADEPALPLRPGGRPLTASAAARGTVTRRETTGGSRSSRSRSRRDVAFEPKPDEAIVAELLAKGRAGLLRRRVADGEADVHVAGRVSATPRRLDVAAVRARFTRARPAGSRSSTAPAGPSAPTR